jgi:seryl-tRNA synthetase
MSDTDRIKELEAKLAKEIEISNQRGNHIEFVLLPQMSDLHFKLKDVKAKLAKAVDAIDGLLAVLPDDEGPEIDYARTTLAELKGEKYEQT